MNNFRYIVLLLTILFTSSCAFNHKFHYPVKINRNVDDLGVFSYGKDTLLFKYNKTTKAINIDNKNGISQHPNFSIEAFDFMSESNNKLHGWLLKPKNAIPKATIVHFHGSAMDILTQYQAISPLIDYGFQIITFDYSGYGFSEGKSTRKNILEDAYSFLNFAKNHQQIKGSKLILYGQSYGGYLAAVIGSNRQYNIDGIVIEGAFTSHKAEAKYEVPFWGNLVKNEKHADKEIKKNRKPILIIHSREDKKVPLKFGKRIYENANEPKEFFEIDKPHILGLQYYSKEISEKIKKMLNKN
ncbi:alpha/beta fold hydrolase [uncultured Aquimarina sp.]|uniref:alpha/beta hydrolase n=1 Tax=uncultured Aquimarina sp. TaxID=575652 RepID=UPI00262412E4|nr:alpha/beta fold hydrolase [uncultured Aquimarina sp.]